MARARRISSLYFTRPCAKSTSSISPGPKQPAVSTFAGSISIVPTSEESRTVVTRHIVTSRAQTVAIERGAQGTAVGKGDCSRTVPGLHKHGLIGIVGTTSLGQIRVMVPRLGQQQRDSAREGPLVHDQELKDVVENGGVGTLAINDRQHALKVVLEHWRVKVWFAGANPVDVALRVLISPLWMM